MRGEARRRDIVRCGAGAASAVPPRLARACGALCWHTGGKKVALGRGADMQMRVSVPLGRFGGSAAERRRGGLRVRPASRITDNGPRQPFSSCVAHERLSPPPTFPTLHRGQMSTPAVVKRRAEGSGQSKKHKPVVEVRAVLVDPALCGLEVIATAATACPRIAHASPSADSSPTASSSPAPSSLPGPSSLTPAHALTPYSSTSTQRRPWLPELTRTSQDLRTVRTGCTGQRRRAQLAPGLHVLYVPPYTYQPRACRTYRVLWHAGLSCLLASCSTNPTHTTNAQHRHPQHRPHACRGTPGGSCTMSMYHAPCPRPHPVLFFSAVPSFISTPGGCKARTTRSEGSSRCTARAHGSS